MHKDDTDLEFRIFIINESSFEIFFILVFHFEILVLKVRMLIKFKF